MGIIVSGANTHTVIRLRRDAKRKVRRLATAAIEKGHLTERLIRICVGLIFASLVVRIVLVSYGEAAAAYVLTPARAAARTSSTPASNLPYLILFKTVSAKSIDS